MLTYADLPTYEQYYACCTLGNAGYQVALIAP
jgi:hypothetical protein